LLTNRKYIFPEICENKFFPIGKKLVVAFGKLHLPIFVVINLYNTCCTDAIKKKKNVRGKTPEKSWN
jgi:hypothetical protein